MLETSNSYVSTCSHTSHHLFLAVSSGSLNDGLFSKDYTFHEFFKFFSKCKQTFDSTADTEQTELRPKTRVSQLIVAQ